MLSYKNIKEEYDSCSAEEQAEFKKALNDLWEDQEEFGDMFTESESGAVIAWSELDEKCKDKVEDLFKVLKSYGLEFDREL